MQRHYMNVQKSNEDYYLKIKEIILERLRSAEHQLHKAEDDEDYEKFHNTLGKIDELISIAEELEMTVE